MTEDPHLRPREAEDLLAYLPPREQVVLGHVIDCAACQQLVASLLGPPDPPAAERRRANYDYSGVWQSLAAMREQAIERLDAERGVSEVAVAGLVTLDPKERRRRVREEGRYRTVSIAGVLLERSHAVAAEAPGEAEDLALLALFVLERLDPEQESWQLLTELRVRAWGLVAHACWAAQKWDAVRDALEEAEKQLVAAGHDTRGLGFRRAMAAFRRSERRTAEAFVALTRAVTALVGRLVPKPPRARPNEAEN
ncbi:MAG: hypothetical protein ACRD2T_04095 [Thermoanaerobaculia bacterium]